LVKKKWKPRIRFGIKEAQHQKNWQNFSPIFLVFTLFSKLLPKCQNNEFHGDCSMRGVVLKNQKDAKK
jgi:hypothetical protein